MLSNLYADDVIIFSYDVDGMQCLLVALQTFCQSSGLAINVDKTKMTVVWTIQPQWCLMYTYKGDHVQFVQSISLALMYPLQMKGMYTLTLDYKLVRKVTIFWKIDATKVILEDGKWN